MVTLLSGSRFNPARLAQRETPRQRYCRIGMGAALLILSASALAAEGIAEKVDEHLRETLKDPSSAMQYEVSGVLPCNDLLTREVDLTCVCYRLNAKNSYGAYTGVKLHVLMAVVLEERDPPEAVGVIDVIDDVWLSPDAEAACRKAGLAPRDAKLLDPR